MAVREIIHIDEELCDGCGVCVPSCAEGAIQIIDGKAKLVSDVYCDGLGACLGDCPQGAISMVAREADEFDEEEAKKHVENISEKKVVSEIVKEQAAHHHNNGGSCPGSMQQSFNQRENDSASALFNNASSASIQSRLTTWPVQLHLLNPASEFLKNSDFLLCADCVPFSFPDFHNKFLHGKTLAIACPKLDNTEPYLNKLTHIIAHAELKSLTVLVMEVPCCSGLLRLAAQAVNAAGKALTVNIITIGIKGDILKEESVDVG